MRHRLLCVFALCLASPMPASASMADFARQQAEQACYNNVMKFCNDAVPDEGRIAACMGHHVAQLDPDCRKVYERGLR